MTNREFSKTDTKFIQACQEALLPNHINVLHGRTKTTRVPGTKDLTRQASKWRMGKGLAFSSRNNSKND